LNLSNELQRHFAHDRSLSSGIKKALTELKALPVLCGEKLTRLGSILGELSAQVSSASKVRSQRLTKENLYFTSPFRELSQLPIGRATEPSKAAARPRLGQLFPPTGGGAEDETVITAAVRSRPGLDEMPVSYYRAHGHRSWYGGFFFPGLYYSASVKTTVSGYDAAYTAGGIYASARSLYETLEGNDILTAILVAGALQVANSSPEVPWLSEHIIVTVCICAIVGADGSCNFNDPSITEGQCHTEQASNVSELESSFGNWGDGCGRAVAHYRIKFNEENSLDFYGRCR